ncbi:MAG: antibiotic biosynthesis monooxygenase, partial [Mesorhizobium sp.]
MFGLIGKMRAARGQRDAVMDVLRETTGALPG